jgi:hypothetical protein
VVGGSRGGELVGAAVGRQQHHLEAFAVAGGDGALVKKLIFKVP